MGKGAKGGSSLGFFLFTREHVTGLGATGPELMTTNVASVDLAGDRSASGNLLQFLFPRGVLLD